MARVGIDGVEPVQAEKRHLSAPAPAPARFRRAVAARSKSA